MNKPTRDRLDRLPAVLARRDAEQYEADTLMVAIADSGEWGAKAALCRKLNVKPQSLDNMVKAARNRIAARTT